MLVKMTWSPSERQLRQFGFTALVAMPLLGWLALGRSNPATWDASQAAVFGMFSTLGLIGGALGWLHPKGLRVAFIAASLATIPVGMVVGELMLLFVYFGIFTPVAALFRLIGRDALQRRFDAAAPSYWTPKAQPANAEQYFRQS